MVEVDIGPNLLSIIPLVLSAVAVTYTAWLHRKCNLETSTKPNI